MSAFSIFTAALACLAPVASAYTQPTGDAPVGNPFTAPVLNTIVTAGQPFTVQWTPTTNGSVSLLLMKGPPTGLVYVSTLADTIDNSGSFVWTPGTDLTPGPTSTTGYGIELIVDATGQYQYTTQFGVSNSALDASASGSASAAAASSAGSATDAAPSSSALLATDSAIAQSTTVLPMSSTDAAATSASATAVSTLPLANASTTLITTPVTASSTTMPATITGATRTTGAVTSASSTGGAAHVRSGFLGVAAVAGVALLAI